MKLTPWRSGRIKGMGALIGVIRRKVTKVITKRALLRSHYMPLKLTLGFSLLPTRTIQAVVTANHNLCGA